MVSVDASCDTNMNTPDKNENTVKLSGLSTHENFVSFLALLGMLRAIDADKPDWRPRVSWTGTIPNLHTSTRVSENDIVRSTIRGLHAIYGKIDFHGKYKIEDFSKLAELTNCGVGDDMAAALMVEKPESSTDDERSDRISPLCLRRGAGHLHFLDIANNIATQEKSDVEIQRTLFGQWNYVIAQKMSFCWDIHEHQPTSYNMACKDRKGSITSIGANILALAGFTAYTCVPVYNMRRATVGCSVDRNTVFWPIWKQPLSFFSITGILSHLAGFNRDSTKQDRKKQSQDLKSYGIESLMEAEIFVDSKYKYVRPARRVF